MMSSVKFDQQGVSLTQVGSDILVLQVDCGYRVRDRLITGRLCGIVEKAFKHGLTSLCQAGHPQEKNRETGVPYITFSVAYNDRWVFVVDEYSGEPIGQVTFWKGHEADLKKAGIPFQKQGGGGKNLFVDYDQLSDALECVSSSIN